MSTSPANRVRAPDAPAAVRLQHHDRAQDGRAPPRRGHHRLRHGQPRRPDAAAHRRQAGRDRAARPTRTATRCRRASRGCAARSATGTSAATASSSTRRPRRSSTIGSKEGIAHLALATLGRGDTVLVPNPSYPIHIYGPVIAGADIRHVPMTPDVDFFAELERAIHTSFPEAEDADHQLPVEPDGAVRRAAVLREDRRARARARHLGRARSRLRRHHVRRLEGAVDHAGAGRARRRGRVLHDVEELQHGRLAHRLHGRQQGPRRTRSRASRATTTTARSRRSRWRRSPRSKGRRTASRRSR